MNVASCAPDKLPICLLGVTTSLPSGKRNADGTPHMEEYAAVITSEPCGTKKEALNYCFHLVHDALIPFGLDTMVSQDEKSLSLVALERQNANASEADKKCNPMNPEEYLGENLEEKKQALRTQLAHDLVAEFGPYHKRPGNNSNADTSRTVKFCCARCFLYLLFPILFCSLADGK